MSWGRSKERNNADKRKKGRNKEGGNEGIKNKGCNQVQHKTNRRKKKEGKNMLYAFFSVITRRLEFICRRFGTLCSIFIGR